MSEDRRTVFVGNIGDEVSEALLHELFLQAGPVEHVKIPQANGKPRSFAFVVFKHECSVPYSIALINHTSLYGRNLKLQTKTGVNYAPYIPHPLLNGYTSLGCGPMPVRPDFTNSLRGMNPIKRSHDHFMKPHRNNHPKSISKHPRHRMDPIPDPNEYDERLNNAYSSQGNHFNDDGHHQKHNRERKRQNDHSHKHDSKFMQPKHHGYKNHRDRKPNINRDFDAKSNQFQGDPFYMQPYNF